MDTTLLQRSSWKNGGQAKQFGTDLWEWEGPVWSFLVRKLKSLGLTVDGISASFCGLRGFAAVCQRPFHRLHKWKRSLRLFLSMVYTTAQRDYAVFWCASSFPKPWLLFYLGFPGLLFRRRRTLTTPHHNPATKQCPVHVCQMYLPLSLSWSIFQWTWTVRVHGYSWCILQTARGNDKTHKGWKHAWSIADIHNCCQIETANRNQRNHMEKCL